MKIIRRFEELPHGLPYPVATIGNFDGVHLGHRAIICTLVRRAAVVGGTPTIITFDPHPLAVLAPGNAPRQIQTLEQKLAAIKSLGVRLAVVIPFTRQLAEMSARDFALRILWQQLGLREIEVGPNFAFGNRREGSSALLKEIGAEVGFSVGKLPQVQFRGSRVSSTAVRQALAAGNVSLVRRLLGRSFSLSGVIVHGTATGSGLKVPTANLRTDNELVPRPGVYVSMLTLEGRRHRAVTNIGFRPTFTPESARAALSIETHVLDFSGALYDRRVGLEFLLRLRDERRFENHDALVAQIRKDVERARRFLRWFERRVMETNSSVCARAEPVIL